MSLVRASLDASRNPKRKAEECLAGGDFVDLARMSRAKPSADGGGDRRGNVIGHAFREDGGRVLGPYDAKLEEESLRWSGSGGRLQFFVKLITGKTILVRASCWDTVRKVMEEVERRSGIPVGDQRVIFRGKQLGHERLLNECGVKNDCVLQMVARMRSAECAPMWREVEDMKLLMRKICCQQFLYGRSEKLNNWFYHMLARILACEIKDLQKHVRVLCDSNFPVELIKVYLSPVETNKNCAFDCITQIIAASMGKSKGVNVVFYPLVLEFGKMLSTVGYDNKLYLSCRKAISHLAYDYSAWTGAMHTLQDILPFVSQTAEKLSEDLGASLQSHVDGGPSMDDIQDFSAFIALLKHVIKERSGTLGYALTPVLDVGTVHDHALEVTIFLYAVYGDLLAKISSCLKIMENSIIQPGKEGQVHHKGWPRYLPILKVLYGISKLYLGAEEHYRTMLTSRKAALSFLVSTYANRDEDPFWALELKGFLDFKARRHLVMLLFPEVHYDYEELHELLIDRSNLLAESFEYIRRADRNTLHSSLFVEFKNEEATGPGVLREWFFMVCQAIFDTGNPLFIACPNDRRRFYLNQASTVEPLHPDYLRFCGRVIALALRHKVQVGIVFDRVFLLQLAGMPVTLEDIRDADPELYRSCKHILDMDAEFVDTDALGLTFVREVDEMGCMKVIELCDGGKTKVVNSCNRAEYVDLLIHNRFVASTSQEMLYFANGFGDILSDSSQCQCFFRSLDLEDLDLLLQGSAADISVEDWKAYTLYNGYKETDPQIGWFWKVVEEMSAAQRRMLLFFWTSVKYLPPEGFRGLASHLHLSRVFSEDRLPSSHTCFLRLSLPTYSSFKMMRAQLSIITQEHVGLSFGTY
uniref:HECT-type E3 ubiquitin transferase n=1 Tax=Kalanchoe fedtschenkoi TaxID=63787 RepID=A0A7N0UHB3_KALFE